jgi:hypothetical protein
MRPDIDKKHTGLLLIKKSKNQLLIAGDPE